MAARHKATCPQTVKSTALNPTSNLNKDFNGVMPDCHGETQNGSGSSSVRSVLVVMTNEFVCGGTVVSTKINGLLSLQLHPYCTICVGIFKVYGIHGIRNL